MKTVALGDVATIERVIVDADVIPEGTKYLGLEHIERGGRVLGYEVIGDFTVASSKFKFDEGHVLYGKLRPNLGKIARPGFTGVCSTDILPIRPGPRIDRNFLAHFLAQPRMIDHASSRATGINLPRLSPTELARFEVPLPSIDEQRRIAAILDRVDSLREATRRSLDEIDQVLSARFVSQFGGETRTRALGDVASFYGGSSLPKGVVWSEQRGGYMLMKVSDMNASGNESLIVATAEWSALPGSRASTVPEGAVVLPKRGAAIATNKKRVLARPAVLDPNLMGVLPDPEALTTQYLFAWFQQFDLRSITSGSSVPQLNKQDLAPLRIPVPTLRDQDAFGVLVEKANRVRAGLGERQARLAALGRTLAGQAFSGGL